LPLLIALTDSEDEGDDDDDDDSIDDDVLESPPPRGMMFRILLIPLLPLTEGRGSILVVRGRNDPLPLPTPSTLQKAFRKTTTPIIPIILVVSFQRYGKRDDGGRARFRPRLGRIVITDENYCIVDL